MLTFTDNAHFTLSALLLPELPKIQVRVLRIEIKKTQGELRIEMGKTKTTLQGSTTTT